MKQLFYKTKLQTFFQFPKFLIKTDGWESSHRQVKRNYLLLNDTDTLLQKNSSFIIKI